MTINVQYFQQMLQSHLTKWWRSRCPFTILTLLTSLIVGCTGGFPLSRLPTPAIVPSGPVRTIDHAMGTTQVPENPQRIVVIDSAALDSVLALGMKPIGSTIYGEIPQYLGDQTQGIEIVGEVNQPNLESILKLQPDLILGTKVSAGRIYRARSRIAPTVLTEGSGSSLDWPENFRLFAATLGKTELGSQQIDAYQQRVLELRTQLNRVRDQRVEETVVSLLVTGEGRVGFYTENSFPGSVLRDIGFARPVAQTRPKRWAAMASREDLDSLDGNVIFLIHSPQHEDSLALEAFTADPIWSQLNAVQQDQIYQVNNEVWIAGRSILAANQILNDISQTLLGDRPNS